jgi:hypothetical protein
MIEPGDRVKLTERGVSSRIHGRKITHVDWAARRGIVQRVNQYYGYVLWDGVKYLDPVELEALVVIAEP